ncbi:MAG: cell division protein SepF [Clostridia bacterium]|nr:cell division protein SepF [Clostridia bacterium]
MSSKDFLGKIMKFMGMDDGPEVEEIEEVKERTKEAPVIPQFKKPGKVVSIHSGGSNMQSAVKVVEPKKYEDCVKIGEYMKSRHQVVINMQDTDSEEAQRIMDFISGCSFALDGNFKKIGKGIFLHVPYNMEITMELERSIVSDRALFNVVGFNKER